MNLATSSQTSPHHIKNLATAYYKSHHILLSQISPHIVNLTVASQILPHHKSCHIILPQISQHHITNLATSIHIMNIATSSQISPHHIIINLATSYHKSHHIINHKSHLSLATHSHTTIVDRFLIMSSAWYDQEHQSPCKYMK